MKFIGLTRGGMDGILAIIETDGEHKYFEYIALESMLKQFQGQQDVTKGLKEALNAIDAVNNLEDVPEFESNIPEQSSLFN